MDIDWHDLPPTLTVVECAAILRIGRGMAYKLIHEETFPMLRLGRKIRVPRDALRQWIDREAQSGRHQGKRG